MLLGFQDLVEGALRGADVARRWMAFWGPIPTGPALLGPFVAVLSVLTLALVTGVAVGSLATLIVALLVLYVLLTEVFGVSIEFSPAE